MFEFARTSWLWLFALTLLFFVAFILARRFRAARVTYGHVWHAVARKLRPPAWKRLLRTLLTLFLSATLLSSAVLYAAGLQKPQAEKPAPLLIAITLDCTPSMRAKSEGARVELAWRRALQVIDALGEDDRAIVFRFEQGLPLGSRWLKRRDRPDGPPATDFVEPDLAALSRSVSALQTPQDVPTEPAALRFVWWLGDIAPAVTTTPAPPRLAGLNATWREPHGVPMLVETFGARANNDAVTAWRWTPTPQGPGRGVIEAQSRSGRALALTGTDEASVQKHYNDGTRFELAADDESVAFDLRVTQPDALTQDDSIQFELPSSPLARAHVAWPAADGEVNPNLRDTLKLFLPGIAVTAAAGPNLPARTSLAVFDRVVPAKVNARFAICFGAIPPAWGRIEPSIRVAAGMQHAESSVGLGFELPDLSLLSARAAVPVVSTALRPLLKGPAGEVLIAEGIIDGTRTLYCGFIPHESTLLEDSGSGGPLLLMRWLQAIRTPPGTAPPPVITSGESAGLHLGRAAHLRVSLESSRWEPCVGDREFALVSGPDGRAKLGPLPIPGGWQVTDEASGGAFRVVSLWRDEAEQSLPFEALPVADAAGLHPAIEPDWRDNLPGALLWLALALLVLEWALWLVGVTE